MVAAEIFVAAVVALAAVAAAAMTLLLKPQYSSSILCLVMSVGPFISCLQTWPATYLLVAASAAYLLRLANLSFLLRMRILPAWRG